MNTALNDSLFGKDAPLERRLVSRRAAFAAMLPWLAAWAAGCSSFRCGSVCGGLFGRGGWRSRLRGAGNYNGPPPATLGTLSDQFWEKQRDNLDATTFVIYQHEFQLNTVRLNYAGEDHVKQIASRLQAGATFPVVIERSRTSVNPNTKYQYPVYPNAELDNQRREVIVKALTAMGITDADNRVVVGLPYSEGRQAGALPSGQGGGSGGSGGFGGGFGGFGGGAGGGQF